MEKPGTDPSIENDVLRNPDHSRLTQEEIAKAVAHHNKKHKEEHSQSGGTKGAQNKKQGSDKPK